jgi:hypothetical protein
MAEWISAVSSCGHESFRVTDLRKPDGEGPTPKQYRSLLESPSWDPGVLRRLLVSMAPLPMVHSFVLEYHEVQTSADRTHDIIGLIALGDGWGHPVGWQRALVPPADRVHGGVPDISDGEREATLRLIGDLVADYRALETMTVPLPPVFAVDPRFGENAQLREEMAELVSEFFCEVSAAYTDHRLATHPYEQQYYEPIADYFPGPAPHRPRKALSSCGGEYAACLADAADTTKRFGIVRPQLPLPRGGLTGRRLEQRVEELVEMSGRLPALDWARRLRVAGFRTSSDTAWLTNALLLSAYPALTASPVAPLVPVRSNRITS